MSVQEPTVFVVDDDEAVRHSLKWLITSTNLRVETFESAKDFLNHYDESLPGCLILDVRMPDINGMDFLDKLVEEGFPIPVIIMSGHGDVPMAVRAMKQGAIDFLEKPFNDEVLLERIGAAIDIDTRNRAERQQHKGFEERLNRLTKREREVMDMIVAGHANKVMASMLGVSAKTVEAHRATVMKKLQVRSVADLVQMVVTERLDK